MILYEYPFNERIRTYLRLEHLFVRLKTLIGRADALDHHFAIQTLFEILDVSARSDMKSDVLKDIERHRQHLGVFRDNPAIDQRVLDQVLNQLDQHYEQLQSQGKTGGALTDEDGLMAIRSRMGIPAGTCSFDLPAYYHWQHLDEQRRRTDLGRWAEALRPLSDAVGMLLGMLRDSGTAQKVMALQGQFQQNLPQGKTFQLMRLRIDPAAGLVPEISGNRLMVSVRLMAHDPEQRLVPYAGEAWFELTLCA